MANLADFLGLVGVGCILLTYFLLQAQRMPSTSMSYLTLNLVGAALILVSLFYHWNLSAVVIETAWILISLMGMWKACQMKKNRVKSKL